MIQECTDIWRGQWSFEGYLPLFQLARRDKIPLVALNVDSETLEKVRLPTPVDWCVGKLT